MTPEERDNLPMRQTIEFEVTACQLRTMDVAADARGLNLSQFMLKAALAAARSPRDAIALLWPDMADEGDDACNCQAIPGTHNYPGPWHVRGDAPHYPCAKSST